MLHLTGERVCFQVKSTMYVHNWDHDIVPSHECPNLV